MPSASTNSNNKNKLMKQASLGCSAGNGGGGGGGPGGSSSTTVTAAVVSGGATKATTVVATANVSIATTAETNNNNTTNNNNGGNINTEGSVSSNNTLSSSLITGKGGEKSVAAATIGIANESAAGNPMRQALITIEHKIRNLEKRKTKLESYRLIQANGKELSSDQKAAVAKYDAVMATLDFARDLSKQMLQFSKDAEKEQKKQARKDLIAKAQAETAKIREVLIIQNILSCFTDDSVRSDFLNGENGAIKLEPTDLDGLEQFCFDIQTRRPESVDDPSFISVAQKAAEYFSMTIDGRPKQYGETTFENLRRVFNQIHECGYLDKIYLAVSDSSNVECNEEEITGTGDIVAAEDSSSRISNSLEENTEKLNITESGVGSNARNTPIASYVDAPELTEQSVNKEQMDLMQKPNVINAMSMPSQSSVPTAAVPMAGVGNYAATPMSQQPNRQQSGSTTPVHVAAMYALKAGAPPQPILPQMQQVVPPAAAMISGLPPQQPAPVAIAPQHRGGDGVNVQLPPGVSTTMPPPMHSVPPPPGAPYPLTTVRAVEQDFFKQHQQQQQQQQKYVQQMRPLAEVIGAGSFYFLQDSELDSPEIIGGSNNSGSVAGTGVVFESQAPNMLVHVSDMPLTGAAADLQQQQQHSKKLVAQQQPPPQQQHQQQPPQQQVDSQHHALQQQQQPPQSQQQQQLQQPPQSQPITTQTFTNQTFPPIQPQPQPPTQLQRHETTPTPSANVAAGSGSVQSVSKTPTMNSGSNGNTPTAQLFQQPQAQSGPQGKVAMYSSDLVIANNGAVPPQQQQQQQMQQQQQPIMIMTRLATPQARLPMQAAGNVPQQQQQPQTSGFPFDTMVGSFSGYEQVQQLAAVTSGAQKLAVAGNIPNVVEDKSRKISGTSDPSDVPPPVNEWEATIKGHASRSTVNSNAAKAAALTSALKQHSSGASVGGNPSPLEPVPTTNKWSTEMNALSARGNTPPSVPPHHSNNNQQNRKNDWSTTGGGNGNSNVGGNSYSNDVVTTHSDNASNHWNANQPQQQQQQQQQHDNNTSGGYGRSGGGGGGRNSNNTYQRRNDDRRGGDRSAGGGNNNYRGRTNNNYGGGGAQSQQQNGSGRGGGGGIYFRNNESAQTGAPNSFYQNGGLYTKDGGSGPRYDNGSGGNNSYRGPRGGGGSNAQRNQGPPRNMGRNSGSSGSNTSTGGGGGSGSSGGYMHPRQTNRMPMGLEKN